MQTSRQKLPNRRPSVTRKISFSGQALFVTVGFCPETAQPMEVFGSSAKAGSAMDHAVSDACITISLALQSGIEPAELGESLGRDGTEPASIVGTICDVLTSEAGR